jgi:hypothetical protein
MTIFVGLVDESPDELFGDAATPVGRHHTNEDFSAPPWRFETGAAATVLPSVPSRANRPPLFVFCHDSGIIGFHPATEGRRLLALAEAFGYLYQEGQILLGGITNRHEASRSHGVRSAQEGRLSLGTMGDQMGPKIVQWDGFGHS